MDAGIEKECSALGGLFQLIMNDMKVKKKPDIQVISLHVATSFFFLIKLFFPLYFLHTYPNILGYL